MHVQTGKDERSRWPLPSEAKEGTRLGDWALASHLRPEVPTSQRCSRGCWIHGGWAPEPGAGCRAPEGRAAPSHASRSLEADKSSHSLPPPDDNFSPPREKTVL